MNRGNVSLGLRNRSYERMFQHLCDTRDMAQAGVMGQVDAVDALQHVVEQLNEFGKILKDEIILIPEPTVEESPYTPGKRQKAMNCRSTIKGETYGQIQARITANPEH